MHTSAAADSKRLPHFELIRPVDSDRVVRADAPHSVALRPFGVRRCPAVDNQTALGSRHLVVEDARVLMPRVLAVAGSAKVGDQPPGGLIENVVAGIRIRAYAEAPVASLKA